MFVPCKVCGHNFLSHDNTNGRCNECPTEDNSPACDIDGEKGEEHKGCKHNVCHGASFEMSLNDISLVMHASEKIGLDRLLSKAVVHAVDKADPRAAELMKEIEDIETKIDGGVGAYL